MSRGIIIARWSDGLTASDDGINWRWANEDSSEGTLFAVMERYLTAGLTMEILSYRPDHGTDGHYSTEEYFAIEEMTSMVRAAHRETE